MEREQFIEALRRELLSRGLDESSAAEKIDPVIGFFERNGMTEIDIDPAGMASEIVSMAVQSDGDAAPAQTETQPHAPEETGDLSAEDEILAGMEAVDGHVSVPRTELPTEEGGEPENDDDVKTAEDPSLKHVETVDDGNRDDDPDDGEDAYDADGDFEGDIDSFSPGGGHKKIRKTEKKRPPENGTEKSVIGDEQEYTEAEDERSDSSKVLFWVIIAVAIPIVLVLSLTMIALYIGFWIVLAALMIFSVAGLIVFVTAGTLVSMVGMIYGTIQLIKGIIPVGMFEIGLGVCVGSAVLLIGILVYNFAIRLIPFAMKMLAKLLGFAFRKGRDGFAALKGLCENI